MPKIIFGEKNTGYSFKAWPFFKGIIYRIYSPIKVLCIWQLHKKVLSNPVRQSCQNRYCHLSSFFLLLLFTLYMDMFHFSFAFLRVAEWIWWQDQIKTKIQHFLKILIYWKMKFSSTSQNEKWENLKWWRLEVAIHFWNSSGTNSLLIF